MYKLYLRCKHGVFVISVVEDIFVQGCFQKAKPNKKELFVVILLKIKNVYRFQSLRTSH